MSENVSEKGDGVNNENHVVEHGDKQWISPDVEAAQSGQMIVHDRTLVSDEDEPALED